MRSSETKLKCSIRWHWNNVQAFVWVSFASNLNATIVFTISLARHPLQYGIQYALSLEWMMQCWMYLLAYLVGCAVHGCTSERIYKVSMLIWYWYHSFIMSAPKTMQNVTLHAKAGGTMDMQDVSINSIKPHSHNSAAAIKLSWIIYSQHI